MKKFTWVPVILGEFLHGGKTKNGVYLLLLAGLAHLFFGDSIDLNQIVANSVVNLPADLPSEANTGVLRAVDAEAIKTSAARAIPTASKVLAGAGAIVGAIGVGHDLGKKIASIRGKLKKLF